MPSDTDKRDVSPHRDPNDRGIEVVTADRSIARGAAHRDALPQASSCVRCIRRAKELVMEHAAAAALAIGITGLGATLAGGRAVGSAVDGIARQPSHSAGIRLTMVLGIGMIESTLIILSVLLKI